MISDPSVLCPACGTPQPGAARFCDSCGRALPPRWDEPRLFADDDGTSLAVGNELREAILAAADRSDCASWFFAILTAFGLLNAIMFTVIYRFPEAQDSIPPIVLGVAWIEALVLVALWLWAGRQPYPASITGLVFIATNVVVFVVLAVPFLDGPQRPTVASQVLLQLGLLWLALRVVVASRNPFGPSKLATPLALNPAPLGRVPGGGDVGATGSQGSAPPLTRRSASVPMQSGHAAASAATSEPHASPFGSGDGPQLEGPEDGAAPLIGEEIARSVRRLREIGSNARISERVRSRIVLPPLRVFQVVVLAVAVLQLSRVLAVITGPTGRFFPFRGMRGISMPLTTLADAAVGVLGGFGLVRGLATMVGSPDLGRAHWLRQLPRGAALWGLAAQLRLLLTGLAIVAGLFRLRYANGGFFFLMGMDVLTAVLCIVGFRLWQRDAFRG